MSERTRRNVLATSSVTLAALAGCTGESSKDDPTPSNGTATDANSSPDREPVYNVEPSEHSDGYVISSDGNRLIGGIRAPNSARDTAEHEEVLHPFDEDAEIYSDGITDDGYAVAFYDKEFVEQEPVHLIVAKTTKDDLDVQYNDELPDSYVTEPENRLFKATVPMDDFYSEWREKDLEESAGVEATFGHIKDTEVNHEDGILNYPNNAKYYILWHWNSPE